LAAPRAKRRPAESDSSRIFFEQRTCPFLQTTENTKTRSYTRRAPRRGASVRLRRPTRRVDIGACAFVIRLIRVIRAICG